MSSAGRSMARPSPPARHSLLSRVPAGATARLQAAQGDAEAVRTMLQQVGGARGAARRPMCAPARARQPLPAMPTKRPASAEPEPSTPPRKPEPQQQARAREPRHSVSRPAKCERAESLSSPARRLFLPTRQGLNVNTADYDGRTALMLSCAKGHEEVARLLIDSGAKLERAE